MGRLIDADVFKENMDYVCTMGGWLEPISSAITEYVKKHIDAQTTVDAVEVVRCCDCEHMYDGLKDDGYLICHKFNYFINADDFCSYGERKTDHE